MGIDSFEFFFYIVPIFNIRVFFIFAIFISPSNYFMFYVDRQYFIVFHVFYIVD